MQLPTLVKYYPPYINHADECREILSKAKQEDPRVLAFLTMWTQRKYTFNDQLSKRQELAELLTAYIVGGLGAVTMLLQGFPFPLLLLPFP